MTLDCIYDPSSNRMQVDSELSMGNYIISDFYQFAELSKGKYAIQNGTERLYTEYDETGNLVNFYYSVLPTVESVNIRFIVQKHDKYTGKIQLQRRDQRIQGFDCRKHLCMVSDQWRFCLFCKGFG